MARKGWDDLSADYRARLERGGIDRASYNRGDSLSAARGHQTRAGLVKEVQKLKDEVNRGKESYDKKRSNQAVEKTENGKPRTVKSLEKLKKALKAMKKDRRTDYDWHNMPSYLTDYDMDGMWYH